MDIQVKEFLNWMMTDGAAKYARLGINWSTQLQYNMMGELMDQTSTINSAYQLLEDGETVDLSVTDIEQDFQEYLNNNI